MLLPSIFGEDLFDDWMMDFPFRGSRSTSLMKTDVKETDNSYELDMDMPGFDKGDIKAELKNGYLTISASSHKNNDEKDNDGRYIRRERYSGSCSRSFYVGDAVTEADIKAKFENGTLTMMIPKKEVQPAVENKKYIAIEG